MADEQQQFDFPSTDDFNSFDDVDSDQAQAALPEDSFDEASATEDEEGCGCVK